MPSSAHSPQKIKLCEHVLLQHFGPIAARVGALLLKRGRLTIREIGRFLNQAPTRTNRGPTDPFSNHSAIHSKSTLVSAPIAGASSSYNTSDPNAPVPVPKFLVEQTIMTLIQHGCAWHSSTDANVGDSNQEFFEININEVLLRLRFGRYIGIAEEELGSTAARIVKLVLQHGKLQASDIVDRIASEMDAQRRAAAASTDPHNNGDPPNGTANGSNKRKADATDDLSLLHSEVARQLTVMLFRTYLRPSTAHQHVAPRDKEIKYEAKLRQKLRGIPTPKELQKIKEEVRIKIAEEREADWEGAGTTVALGADGLVADRRETRRGLLRKQQSAIAVAGAASKSKRTRTSAKDKKGKDKGKDKNGVNGVHTSPIVEGFDPADDYEIDPTVWLRVHFDRFDVHLRDELMIDAVREKYNNTAAEVFRQLIQAGDASTKKSVRDVRSAPIAISSLAYKMPSDLSLQKGFDRRSFGKDKASLPSKQEFLAEYCAIFSHSEDLTGKALRLMAPASDSSTKTAGGSKVSSSLTIEFSNVAERMRRDLLRNVVEDKFGTAAIRIMNILREKGKLEEKHISKLALVSISETRDLCSRLFHASLLGLQEVPKTKDRDPAKTFFLWFVDEAKCRAWLLDHLYQSLARLGQRRNDEMRRQMPLLRKVERSDVKLDTVGLLTEWERESWARLQNTLQMLTVAEMRVEMDVFVMRDLASGTFVVDE
ncbi:RNA polymerase III subunit RPC82-related, helix-turn-helix [Kalmanozyma brasiliensis GHG001]|uniref:DNA-directed RNA polymerase III subunit RPC3 n=1 Tax=Kalmanozyma brasiliensis (strain GHG001) TaxID=1365824 RepID=V5ETH4_KALBG|nr:RNA polymerase III subunit RPC82-related, helix-turn-helix [Kalmanozyma brasiliensis GHG001]EST05329.1 RNA polymerase III subunit RPC82-related, helix-turn-helix [Kalmanozyma brasiliensis GHG001]